MKIICGERVLDLDRMNAVKPDGEHVWVELQPFTYSPSRLPDSDIGTYLLTPDQGAVSFRDMAFKILVDMGVWSGAGCVKYLIRDIARGIDRSGSDWSTASLPDMGAAGAIRSGLELRSIYMPCPAGILSINLGALFDAPCDLDRAVFGMLSDYIYVRDDAPFAALHDSVSKLLASFGPDSFVQFVEGVYGVVSCDPDDVRSRLQPAEMQDVQDIQDAGYDDGDVEQSDMSAELETDPETGSDESTSDADQTSESEPEKPLDLAAMSNASVRDLPRRPGFPGGSTGLFSSGRKLKGSDLTGTDETYSMEYYAGFYRDAMEKADSTGFADQLIKARAGHGTAPIAILEEAVQRWKSAVVAQHGAGGDASELRGVLLDMARTLTVSAGELESMPEPKTTSESVPDEPKPAPEQVPDTKPADEQVPDTKPADEQDASDGDTGNLIPAVETDSNPVPDPGHESEPEPETESDSTPDPEPGLASEPEYDIPDYGDETGGYDEDLDEDGPPDEGDDDDEPDGI